MNVLSETVEHLQSSVSSTLQPNPDPSISYKSTTFMTNEEMRSLQKKKKKTN